MAEAAVKAVVRGYKALKIDPFGAGDHGLSTEEFDRRLAILGQGRKAAGDEVELFIEGHGRFELTSAINLARALEPYRPSLFEEPMIPELSRYLPELIVSTEIPVALGERLP